MKKLLLLLLLIVTGLFIFNLYSNVNLNGFLNLNIFDSDGFEFNPEVDHNQVAVDLEYEYFSFENGIKIIKIPKSSAIRYFSQANVENKQTTREVGFDSNIVINAGYFREDLSHAGLLKANGRLIQELSSGDSQLNSIVNFDSQDFTINDLNFDLSQSQNAFQTGPLMIFNNEIQKSSIDNSINGTIRAFRSVIATDNSSIYFISTSRSFTLELLSEELLNLNIFDGDLTATNLDGGSSVSLYSFENSEINIGVSKKLPYYLIVERTRE